MAKRTDIFKPGKYGSFVKYGKLFDFSPEHILVMAPWPDPRAWVKTSGTGFRVTRKHADEFFRHALFAKDHLVPKPTILSSGQRLLFPEDDYISFYEQVGRYYELRRAPYFDAMPDEVRNDLLRYSGRRWHLLSLFARCPGALDLSRSNPGLCYALASNWVFHRPAVKQPVRAARAMVMRKQKQILEWLGFPGTEPARRILAKIMPKALGVASLLYLRYRWPAAARAIAATRCIVRDKLDACLAERPARHRSDGAHPIRHGTIGRQRMLQSDGSGIARGWGSAGDRPSGCDANVLRRQDGRRAATRPPT